MIKILEAVSEAFDLLEAKELTVERRVCLVLSLKNRQVKIILLKR